MQSPQNQKRSFKQRLVPWLCVSFVLLVIALTSTGTEPSAMGGLLMAVALANVALAGLGMVWELGALIVGRRPWAAPGWWVEPLAAAFYAGAALTAQAESLRPNLSDYLLLAFVGGALTLGIVVRWARRLRG